LRARAAARGVRAFLHHFASADESQQFYARKNWHAFHMERMRKSNEQVRYAGG
jgi:hypothetical protein